MVSSRFGVLLSLIHLLIIMITMNITQALGRFHNPPFEACFCLDKNGNYTSNSTYHTNLNRLLYSLHSSNNDSSGFYSWSYGVNTDKIYATGLCRGDLNPGTCDTCLGDSAQFLLETCPNQKEAIGWYDNCTLRYSIRPIDGGVVEEMPAAAVYGGANKSSSSWVNQPLMTLLGILKSEAAMGGSLHKFAVGNTTVSDSNQSTIYALVQCTPDLSQLGCSHCLQAAFGRMDTYYISGRYVSASCNLRYDDHLFFEIGHTAEAPLPSPPLVLSRPPPPPSANTTISGGKKSNTSRTVIIALVPFFVSLVLITSSAFI